MNNAEGMSVTKVDIKPHININPINNQFSKNRISRNSSMYVWYILNLLQASSNALDGVLKNYTFEIYRLDNICIIFPQVQ